MSMEVEQFITDGPLSFSLLFLKKIQVYPFLTILILVFIILIFIFYS